MSKDIETSPIFLLLLNLLALWFAFRLGMIAWQLCHGDLQFFDELFDQKDV